MTKENLGDCSGGGQVFEAGTRSIVGGGLLALFDFHCAEIKISVCRGSSVMELEIPGMGASSRPRTEQSMMNSELEVDALG